jgi:type 1 glutamine amidotransferase
MKRLALASVLFALVAFSGAAEDQPIRALMITGGCCHDYENQKRIISEGVSARAKVQWTIVHEGGESRTHKVSIYDQPEYWKGFDVIVHNECFGQVDDAAFVDKIAAPHTRHGVPAVALHCSTHSYRAVQSDAWRNVLGVASFSHEKNRDLTVRNQAPNHPVMQGFPEQWLDKADELYKVDKFWPTAVSLGVAYGQDTKKDHTVIWTNLVNDTRVFATTLGHGNHTVSDPVYLDLITRGILWATGRK